MPEGPFSGKQKSSRGQQAVGWAFTALLWVCHSAWTSPMWKSLRRIWVEGHSEPVGSSGWGLSCPQGILPRRSQPHLHSSPAPGSRRIALGGEREQAWGETSPPGSRRHSIWIRIALVTNQGPQVLCWVLQGVARSQIISSDSPGSPATQA